MVTINYNDLVIGSKWIIKFPHFHSPLNVVITELFMDVDEGEMIGYNDTYDSHDLHIAFSKFKLIATPVVSTKI